MTTKEKAKCFNDGLEQGIRLQKEKQKERIRKVLYMLVINLEEDELEILSKALNDFFSNDIKISQ